MAINRETVLDDEGPSTDSLHTLAALEYGEAADIAGFAADFAHGDRYAELGFTLGTPVKLLRRALFGDPIVILVRGTRYALRKADAERIHVKKAP